jgi:hypothetical protein
MRSFPASGLFFALIVIKEALMGEAKIKNIRGRRGLKGSSLQRTTLSESDSENYPSAIKGRGLEDYPPCTYYYPTRKSKFNKFDDDWYDPCQTVVSEYPTPGPSVGSSNLVPRTRPSSVFFSTAPPLRVPSASSNPEDDPPLTIVTEQVSPASKTPIIQSTIGPTISPSSLNAILAPSEAPVVPEETSVEVEIDVDVPIKENGLSCLQAKAGRVVPTSVNFTIYYKYELLAEQEANMTDVVWPEVDRAVQRFLALTMIDCDIDVKTHGTSPTFRSRLKSIAPEPIDSVGSLYPNGWSRNVSVGSNTTSCTNIVIDNELLAKKALYCDVVTGSITLYLSEVSYMDTANDPSVLFLDYRDEVFKFLRDEINEGGEDISNYFDDSIGIRGFYLISESTNLNLRPISTVPDAASNEVKPSGSNKKMPSSTPTILGSLATLVVFTMAAGAFAIYRKKKHVDQLDNAFKQNTTPRMDDNEMEFYDLDISHDGSTGDAVLDSSNNVPIKRFFPQQGDDLNQSQEYGDDVPRITGSDFDAIYDQYEKNSCHSTSFDYSQQGVSMTYSLRPDASIDGFNSVEGKSIPDPDMDHEEHPEDESFTLIQRSIDPRSPSESPVSSSKPITLLPVKGSPALEYILALGSSILSSSNKPFDEASIPEDQNDVESLSTITSSVEESIASTNTQGAKVSPSSEIGERYTRTAISPNNTKPHRKNTGDVSLNKRDSPNSVTNWSILKTPSSLSSFDRDDESSIESPPSSPSECNKNSRVEYLKNRRKELENRFQNYRRSLSESMTNLSNSPSGPWSASREFSRSVSIYKNSDQSFSSSGIASSNVALGEGFPISARATKMVRAITSATSDCTEEGELPVGDANSESISGKQHSRTPRVLKNYTSLNDIEEILENEQSWIVELPENDNEKQIVDKFISSHSSETTPEPTQFQADTVIL